MTTQFSTRIQSLSGTVRAGKLKLIFSLSVSVLVPLPLSIPPFLPLPLPLPLRHFLGISHPNYLLIRLKLDLKRKNCSAGYPFIR